MVLAFAIAWWAVRFVDARNRRMALMSKVTERGYELAEAADAAMTRLEDWLVLVFRIIGGVAMLVFLFAFLLVWSSQ